MTTRSRTPQLLLFAALLLGIVTMHTLGHPSAHTSLHGPGHPSSTMSPHEHAAEPLLTTATATGTGTDMDMDPLSVCLAVLGGFTLALLLALAVGHPWTSGTAHPPLARLLRALWPNPPPPRTLLSRLSVLRI